MCTVLCRFFINTAPDVFSVVQVLYDYSPWCVWCCAGSVLDIIKAKLHTGNCTMRVNMGNYGLASESAYCLTSRLNILIFPAGQCFHSPVSLEWKSRSYVGYSSWHIVAEPGVTVSPPLTQLMPVLLWFHPVFRWRDGSWRATVMSRNKPALFLRPSASLLLKITSR